MTLNLRWRTRWARFLEDRSCLNGLITSQFLSRPSRSFSLAGSGTRSSRPPGRRWWGAPQDDNDRIRREAGLERHGVPGKDITGIVGAPIQKILVAVVEQLSHEAVRVAGLADVDITALVVRIDPDPIVFDFVMLTTTSSEFGLLSLAPCFQGSLDKSKAILSAGLNLLSLIHI